MQIVEQVLLLLNMIVVGINVGVVVIEDLDVRHVMVVLHCLFVLHEVLSLVGKEASVSVSHVSRKALGMGWSVVMRTCITWRTVRGNRCGWRGHSSSSSMGSSSISSNGVSWYVVGSVTELGVKWFVGTEHGLALRVLRVRKKALSSSDAVSPTACAHVAWVSQLIVDMSGKGHTINAR